MMEPIERKRARRGAPPWIAHGRERAGGWLRKSTGPPQPCSAPHAEPCVVVWAPRWDLGGDWKNGVLSPPPVIYVVLAQRLHSLGPETLLRSRGVCPWTRWARRPVRTRGIARRRLSSATDPPCDEAGEHCFTIHGMDPLLRFVLPSIRFYIK